MSSGQQTSQHRQSPLNVEPPAKFFGTQVIRDDAKFKEEIMTGNPAEYQE